MEGMAPRPRRASRPRDPARRDATRALATFALVSLLAHVGAVWVVPSIAARVGAPLPVTYEIDLQPGDGTPRDDGIALADTPASRTIPGGADSPQNIDADDPGRGGDGVGASAVLLLLPTEAPLTLTDATWNATGTGREHAKALEQTGYILIANHASNLDPLVLMSVLGRRDVAFVAKAETLRRPLLGREAGIRPGDLVGAIANEAGLPSRAIGAVEIADRHSIVELPEEVIDDVARVLSKAWIKGKKVAVRRDKA
jgi:hypothetical protein